ncbi:MAG: hypothetical protein FWB78_01010 [Treponema sp.]|nr:hypothetical protein [Treponema sp.]
MKLNRMIIGSAVAAALVVASVLVLTGCGPSPWEIPALGGRPGGDPPAPPPPQPDWPDPELVLPFDPGPQNPDAVWTMVDCDVTQGLTVGVIPVTTPMDPQALGQWLQISGAANGSTHVVENEDFMVGGLFLRRVRGGYDWHTFDIRTTAQNNLVNFEEDTDHVITVWGHAPAGAVLRFGMADSPHTRWPGETTAGDNGLFMLRRLFTWDDITLASQNRIRFLMDGDDSRTFEIFNISVVPFAEVGEDAAAWQDVIDSPFIGARTADLTATADGILVSGRGTGEHAHNHGLTIDIVGLRALADVTPAPAIEITGTATAASGRMEMQGVGAGADITSGAFTITIGGGAAVNVPGWLSPSFPVIGTGPGQHFNYTITGITIGGICIKELLDGEPGDPDVAPHLRLPGTPGNLDAVRAANVDDIAWDMQELDAAALTAHFAGLNNRMQNFNHDVGSGQTIVISTNAGQGPGGYTGTHDSMNWGWSALTLTRPAMDLGINYVLHITGRIGNNGVAVGTGIGTLGIRFAADTPASWVGELIGTGAQFTVYRELTAAQAAGLLEIRWNLDGLNPLPATFAISIDDMVIVRGVAAAYELARAELQAVINTANMRVEVLNTPETWGPFAAALAAAQTALTYTVVPDIDAAREGLEEAMEDLELVPTSAVWQNVITSVMATGGGHGGHPVTTSASGITVHGRAANHAGIGLNVAAMRALSTETNPDIVITGVIQGEGNFEVLRDGGNWGANAGNTTGVTILGTTDFATGTAHRLITNPGNSHFTVTEIMVGGVSILELLDNGGDNDNGNSVAAWQEVLSTVLDASSTHAGGTTQVAATANGIAVTNRNANHWGIGIDVPALRALNTANGEIIISGTATMQNRMQLDGVNAVALEPATPGSQWDPPNPIHSGGIPEAGGSFTITIPTTALPVTRSAAEPWTWSTGDAIGVQRLTHNRFSGPEGIADFTITGITVGGVSILELLGN